MRYQTVMYEQDQGFIKSNKAKEPFDKFIEVTKQNEKKLLHLSSASTSTSLSSDGRDSSEDYQDDNKCISKHQATLERRHKNFQVKKKTEVRELDI